MSSSNFAPQPIASVAADRTRQPGDRPVVIALHCSGGDGNQWRKLARELAPSFDLIAPSFIGTDPLSPWLGQHRFRLADEAERILAIIDACEAPVHLVGHSYGGGVALRVAMSRPDRIASLSLYEPSAFHLLRQLGRRAEAELGEIEGLARSISEGLSTGAYIQATAGFVDYWNGVGCWASLREPIRDSLVRWLPYAALHFHALLWETMPLAAMRVPVPTLILRGEHALPPSRLIAELLADETGTLATIVPGAGHMGPATHAADVNALIVDHITSAQAMVSPVDRLERSAA